jgi:hypothetical protein
LAPQRICSEQPARVRIAVGESKARVDTTLRKLQSVLRDNVNTSYGYRGELAK